MTAASLLREAQSFRSQPAADFANSQRARRQTEPRDLPLRVRPMVCLGFVLHEVPGQLLRVD